MTPSERSIRARLATETRWAGVSDRSAETVVARAAASTALDRKLAEQFNLDPDSPDYAVRLAHARRAHFARLALASAKARRLKKAGSR